MNYKQSALILIAFLFLSGCSSGLLGSAPTPEAWQPPPSVVAKLTATAAPNTSPTPAATSEMVGDPPATTVATPTSLPETTYIVQRGTVEDQLTFQAQVVPSVQRQLSFATDGIVKTLLVEPMATVSEGQLLAELDLSELKTKLEDAEFAYDQARMILDRNTQERQFAVRRAQLDLDTANVRLAALKSPPDNAKITAAQTDLQKAQAALDRVRNDASAAKNHAEQLYKLATEKLIQAQAEYGAAYNALQKDKNDKTRARFKDAEAALKAAEEEVARTKIDYDTAYNNEIALVKDAEATVALAQATLNTLLAGPRPSDVADAERGVRLAELALDEARQRAQPDPELAQRVKAALRDVNSVKKKIEGSRIYAPFAGQIAAVDVLPGIPVAAEQPVITLVDASRLELAFENTGSLDMTGIRVGHPVEITFTRYSDRIVTGTVRMLPVAGSESSGVSYPTQYRIAYNPLDLKLDVGDLAEIRITRARKDNVLWLPRQAVIMADRPSVMVKTTEGWKRVEVEIGIVSRDRVEIRSVLQEGDVVLEPKENT